MNDYLQKYLNYLYDTDGNTPIEWFDYHWEPIGPLVRKELIEKGLVKEVDGELCLLYH